MQGVLRRRKASSFTFDGTVNVINLWAAMALVQASNAIHSYRSMQLNADGGNPGDAANPVEQCRQWQLASLCRRRRNRSLRRLKRIFVVCKSNDLVLVKDGQAASIARVNANTRLLAVPARWARNKGRSIYINIPKVRLI
ncbi:hypothetical protein F5Y12DRAFT_715610 [Xylaria sp. FL1777]|nr:hypothetical protein F5Y12DRAFT_715610 [Xylaria sp. FL1777]